MLRDHGSLPVEYATAALTGEITRQASAEPVMRGRKLVLNYTDGSPCEDGKPKRHLPRKLNDEDGDDKKDDHDDEDETDDDRADKGKDKGHSKTAGRRKSTIISIICDKEPLGAKAHLQFVGSSPDDCTYFFEAKSIAGCPGAVQDTQQTLGPGGVFGVM